MFRCTGVYVKDFNIRALGIVWFFCYSM